MNPTPGPDGPTWRKATASGVNGCVEVAFTADGEHVLMRNSRLKEHLHLAFTEREFLAFCEGVRNGEFDPEWWQP